MAMYKSHEEDDFLDFSLDDFLSGGDTGSSPASLGGFWDSRLCIPDDPIEDLEWFPNFTDSFISLSGIPSIPDHGSLSLSGFPKTPDQEAEDQKKKATPRKGFEDGCLRKVIPSKKPRSKRVGRRDWTSMKVHSPQAEGGVVAEEKSGGGGGGVVLGRRCTHCGVENTPQWRKGPMGPKTLCNACGVRYKSGRLVPEYRPAASPNFIDGVYSNSHKKIMKMREVRCG